MTKTDNSFLLKKIEIRKNIYKENYKVLDCYAGFGNMWKFANNVTSIEKRKNINIEALTGDNLKLLSALDLNKYDIIDLDAYGTPSNQLEIIKKKSTKENQYICLTMIQSGIGGIPNKVLNKNNITTKMLKKAKTIFYKNYQQKMYTYLIKLFKNIKIIHWYSDSAKRKNYAIIQINLDKSL